MRIRIFERLDVRKQKNYIQIIGLVLAILTCIFVGQYSVYEYSYDKFNKDHHLIYRTQSSQAQLLGQLAKEQLSNVEKFARLHPCYRGVTILSGDNSFHETGAYFADGALFEIFSFPVIKGEAVNALSTKNKMVISERYAKKYFGNENPIGKVLLINGSYESDISYTVAGVFKDIPENSHVKFDILFSIENILVHRMYTKDEPWKWKNFFTYFKLTQAVDEEKFGQNLAGLALANGMEADNNDDKPCQVAALTDLHFNGQTNYMDNNGTSQVVKIRILIALVILLIAWLNYVNIGLGKALKNDKVSGIKKVLGASSRDIWLELLRDSLQSNIFAYGGAVVLFFIVKNIFLGLDILPPISLSFLIQLFFWLGILILQLFGSLLVSLLIYVLLSRQKLVNSLSKHSQPVKGNRSPWTVLFVLQFGASVVLICFSLFSTKQIQELMEVETGMQTNQVLAIHSANYSIDGDISQDRKAFEQEVLKIPGISAATSCSYIPGSRIASCMDTRLAWKTKEENIECRMNFIGYDYVSLFGHKIIAGRDFSKEFPSDAEGIIINETLAKFYGFKNPADAIGKEIFWEFRNVNRHIIGVMEDFHHQSADVAIEPTLFQLWDQARGYCLLKINTINVSSTIKEVEKLWEGAHPGNAFDYLWIDEHYQKQYAKWVDYVFLVKILSLIAIIIACIGLFGLSIMILNKRIKEIGVRKVNGAKVSEVLLLLNKDFVKWVAIAFVIATPIAWYVMNRWLENFAHKTTLSWWIFVMAGIITISIALLTVSWQTWRAARRNPVEALRYE